MALIEWRKEFETGVAEVDHEHRELVELINAMHASIGANAAKEIVSDFLGEVFARISAHFALEETVMRTHGYDDLAAHKSEHEALLDQLRDIMDAYDREGRASPDAALERAVRDWFINHFKTSDARLHRILGH